MPALHALYAVEMSAMQLKAATLPALREVATPGGKPVMEVPGEVPTEPMMTVLPVEVTVWPPQAPKSLAEPMVMAMASLIKVSRSTAARVLGYIFYSCVCACVYVYVYVYVCVGQGKMDVTKLRDVEEAA